jgi:four helix bundle protein
MTYRDNEGYKKLIVWQNCKLLRKRVYDITSRFPKSEYRRVSQMNDAARSTKQNLQEGYKSSLPKYINYTKNICRPSLSELHGDIEDCYEDKLISKEEFEELDDLCKRTDYLFNKLIKSLIVKSQFER